MSSLQNMPNSAKLIQLSGSRATIVSVLDIGTSKICCFIAKLKPDARLIDLPGRSHSIEVLGIGHQLSRGIKGGVVVDMDAAERCIRAAVDAAEKMAGLTVDSVIVNVSCGRLFSDAFTATTTIAGKEVREIDVKRVLRAGREHNCAENRTVVHAVPIGYRLDGDSGIEDPCGMVAEELGVDIHVVSGEMAPLRNLSLCISRCHLNLDCMVVTPYASALSSLVPDESKLGALCIDMGGGTTSVSIFRNGQFVYADVIAIGGSHVTNDIARGLSTPINEAERIKTLYGCALASESDEREILTVPMVGDDPRGTPNQIPRSVLTGIIRPRLEEVFELLRDRLKANGFARYAGRRTVLTGGACQLPGVREMATQILDKQVRVGKPLGISGLPEPLQNPAFAAISGLLVYPQIAQREIIDIPDVKPQGKPADGYLARVGQWFKESF